MVALHCSDCEELIDEVSEDTFGHIGTCTLCDSCDQKHLDEIFEQ